MPGNQWRLVMMLVLTFIFFVLEIITGYVTYSLSLISDSFHMLSDIISLLIALVSIRMTPKKWAKNTFGWARAEVLGALVNSVFLCALCFSILIESIGRFLKPDLIHDPHLLLYVGGLGLFINLIGLFLFKEGHHHHHHHHHHPSPHSHNNNHHNHLHHHDHHDTNHDQHLPALGEYLVCQGDSMEDRNENSHPTKEHGAPSSGQMNMRGVFLHVMADALGSVIVMISAIVVIYTEWSIRPYIDPILSVLMVCLILRSTWPLLTESAMILLQTVPTHIEVDSLRERLTQEIQGVLAVHEFHVWQLAGDKIIASAHIRCHNLQDYMRIAEKVKEFFHNEGIHSTTIQPEFIDFDNDEPMNNSYDNCVLDCPPTQGNACAPQTCCGVQKSSNSDPTNVTIAGSGEELSVALLTKRKNGKKDQSEDTTDDATNAQGLSQPDILQVITSTASV